MSFFPLVAICRPPLIANSTNTGSNTLTMNFDNSSIMWSTGKAAPMAFSSDIYTIEISFLHIH